MRELNTLVYNTIKTYSPFRTLTGATTQDPRIYKTRTPVKLPVTDAKPAYAIYFQTGSSKPYLRISPIEKNNYSFIIEIYGKDVTVVSELGYHIEKLFSEKRFTTTSFIINYTQAFRGSTTFDDGRQLYFETVTINMSNIFALDEAS